LEFFSEVLTRRFLPGGAVLLSERSQALRNWNISLLGQEFLGLEFLTKVLIWKFLPDAAVLSKVSGTKRLETGT
ncbi:hypothetical protein, partial [Lentilactobacillus kisonensis]|uniref:hypothetical protein n=1 Tax=Lentilactobacillus kisonensis TaxID=481722 RepID=UPI001C65FC56